MTMDTKQLTTAVLRLENHMKEMEHRVVRFEDRFDRLSRNVSLELESFLAEFRNLIKSASQSAAESEQLLHRMEVKYGLITSGLSELNQLILNIKGRM